MYILHCTDITHKSCWLCHGLTWVHVNVLSSDNGRSTDFHLSHYQAVRHLTTFILLILLFSYYIYSYYETSPDKWIYSKIYCSFALSYHPHIISYHIVWSYHPLSASYHYLGDPAPLLHWPLTVTTDPQTGHQGWCMNKCPHPLSCMYCWMGAAPQMEAQGCGQEGQSAHWNKQ